jgi:hypothetical protein
MANKTADTSPKKKECDDGNEIVRGRQVGRQTGNVLISISFAKDLNLTHFSDRGDNPSMAEINPKFPAMPELFWRRTTPRSRASAHASA